MPESAGALTVVTDSTPPIGCDVIGERLHNGGIIRAKQGDIVGGNRFGGLAGGRLHLDSKANPVAGIEP